VSAIGMTNSERQNREFETSDIDVAAFLLTNNVPMSGITREQDHLEFHFSRPEECAQLSRRFMMGNDSTSAKTLLGAAKHLRRLVRENL